MMMVAKTLGLLLYHIMLMIFSIRLRKMQSKSFYHKRKKESKHSQKKNEDGQKNNITRKKRKEKVIYIHT